MSLIFLCVGPRGSGKTLSAVILAHWYNKRGYIVYSNIWLNPSYFYWKKLRRGQKLHDCVVLLDEAHLYFDSRYRPKAEVQRWLKLLTVESRHRNIYVIATTQNFNAVDKMFRQNLNYIIVPSLHKTTDTLYLRIYRVSGVYPKYSDSLNFLRQYYQSAIFRVEHAVATYGPFYRTKETQYYATD